MYAAGHQAHAPAVSQAAQAQQQAQEEARRREAARRQARKPTDLDIDDDLAEATITDAAILYRKLRDQEKRLDAIMTKKRLDILEGTSGQMPSEGVLRLFISNTAEGQPWQMANDDGNAGFNDDGTFDFADNNQARYRVKIEGKLLEGSDDILEDSELKSTLPPMAPIKMSHFFKRVTVDFNRPAALQSNEFNKVEWLKKDGEADVDCIAFGRKSDEELQITINLYLDEQPERFKLSSQLAWILDMDTATRADVVQGIWDYARLFKLTDPFPNLPELILEHLSPLEPIKLPYTIRIDKDYIAPEDESIPPSKYMIYDIRVKVPSTTKRLMQAIISSPRHMANLKKITQVNDDTALLLEKARHLNSKRKFLLSLSQDPATFVKRWTSSQQRDLEIILAEAGRGGGDEGYAGEEFRRGGKDGAWGTDLAREAVGLWLARQKNH
jgi:SWI/SNF-related matrix-associated actin-dependent regulator of chromatin subfamily D